MPITLNNSRSAPQESDFTPLASHDSKTPDTFFGGRTVLYKRTGQCDVTVKSAPGGAIQEWWQSSLGTDNRQTGRPVQAEDVGGMSTKEDVDVFVTSEALMLSRKSVNDSTSSQNLASATLNIPYPAISIHATQRLWKTSKPTVGGASDTNAEYSSNETGSAPSSRYTIAQDDSPDAQQMSAVYLQLDPSHHLRSHMNPNEDNLGDSDDTVELLVVPPADTQKPDMEGTVNGNSSSDSNPTPNQDAVDAIFEALSRCADLHPDPADEDEDDEMYDDTGAASAIEGVEGMTDFPGEGGWITADNAHEFEGQFAVDVQETEDGVILGPGAGTRRARESDGRPPDGETQNGAQEETDGVHPEDGQNKWQRTS